MWNWAHYCCSLDDGEQSLSVEEGWWADQRVAIGAFEEEDQRMQSKLSEPCSPLEHHSQV